jgi:hypothetical protein
VQQYSIELNSRYHRHGIGSPFSKIGLAEGSRNPPSNSAFHREKCGSDIHIVDARDAR